MKVLLLSQFYPPEMEPSGFMVSSLSHYLASEGDDVQVLCGFANFPQGKFYSKKWYQLFKRIDDKGVKVLNVFVIPSDNTSNIKRIINYISYFISSLFAGLFVKRPEVIIATSPPMLTALTGLLLSKIYRCKFILDIRDIWPESAKQMGNLKAPIIIKTLEYLEKSLYEHAHSITVATPGMIKIIEEKLNGNNKNISFIPCGVEIPDNDRASRNPFDHEDREKFCVLYAGLHGHAQGLITLLETAKRLEYCNDIVFYLIGDGPEKEILKRQSEDLKNINVKFKDPVSKNEIRDFYDYAGCAIVPLLNLEVFNSVFPSKTFELMSYGTPTVVGVGGEIARFVETTQSGLSVLPEDIESYCNGILRYYQDSEFRSVIMQNAKNTAKEYFDYKVTNSQFKSIIDNFE
tara:strand:- start:1444 stop:2655 length:1212 start_codon:yes stop_codon:yes gene_type:complete